MAAAQLVGFDLKLDPAGLSLAWTDERRRQYLLNDAVEVPLSVDPMVWPSRFWQASVPPGMGIPQRIGTIAVPALTPGYNALGLWDSLERLEGFVSTRRLPNGSAPLVAVLAWPGDRPMTLVGDSGQTKVIDTWPSLGFDVADGSLVSGLVNCGYEPAEREALQARWAARLNHVGLLSSLDAAFEFRDITDVRVPEHAPFVVFELRSPST
jgi:hypothetical protein